MKPSHQGLTKGSALTGVALLVGHWTAEQKVAGSIPGQGICLSFKFSPWLGHVFEATD